MTFQKAFGEALTASGLSVAELSRKSQLSVVSLNRYRKNGTIPRGPQLAKLVGVLPGLASFAEAVEDVAAASPAKPKVVKPPAKPKAVKPPVEAIVAPVETAAPPAVEPESPKDRKPRPPRVAARTLPTVDESYVLEVLPRLSGDAKHRLARLAQELVSAA